MRITLATSRKNCANEFFVFLYMVLLEFIVAIISDGFLSVMFYFIVLDICMILAWLSQNTNRSGFLIAAACISIFVIGFRAARVDDFTYMQTFSSVRSIGAFNTFLATGSEPGYLLVNQIVSFFTSDYLVLQVICAILFVGIFFAAIYRFKNYISFPIAVLVFHAYLYFSILESALVRISIAIAIIAFSLYWLVEKKPRQFIIGVVIAALFHYSALVALLFLPFAFTLDKNDSRTFRRSVLLSIIIIPVGMLIIAIFIVPLLSSKYAGYGIIGSIDLSITSFDTLPVFFFGLYCLYRSRKTGNQINMGNNKFFYLMLTITLISSIWSVFSGMVALGRAVYYFGIGIIFLLSMIDKIQKDCSLQKTIFQMGIVTYAIVYVAYTRLLNAESIETLIPYANVFFHI